MTDNDKTLTTGEFSKITGLAVSTITQMLRQGRIRGEKQSGKWAIDESEIKKMDAAAQIKHEKSPAGFGPIFDRPAAKGKSYDVVTFSQMTYLTEKGVRQWLAKGRLSGSIDAGGKRLIDAANLDRPEIMHLVRS